MESAIKGEESNPTLAPVLVPGVDASDDVAVNLRLVDGNEKEVSSNLRFVAEGFDQVLAELAPVRFCVRVVPRSRALSSHLAAPGTVL